MLVSRRHSVLLAASVVSLFSLRAHAAGTLTWDGSGSSPTNPQDGSGAWSTTAALWSNGTTDIGWINDGTESAAIGQFKGQGGTITVGTTINVASIVNYTLEDDGDEVEINSGGQLNAGSISNVSPMSIGYISTVLLNGGTLNLMGGSITNTDLILHAGTLENLGGYNFPFYPAQPGLGPTNPGAINIAGTNSFTSGLMLSASTESVHLLAGASLGNTGISFSYGGLFTADTGTSAGSTGSGTAGASLTTLNDGGGLESTLTIGGNGSAGAFTINQQSGYTGSGLTLAGGIMNFYLTPAGSSELVDNGTAATVSNVNQINLLPDGGLSSLTPGNTYTLISDPSGGLTGTFEFSNGTDSELFSISGNNYPVRLNDTSTAVTVTVVPEPATISVLAIGLLGLAQRRQRR